MAANPWWLTTKYNFDPEQGSYQTYYDATTGRQVFKDANGRYAYTLPKEAQWGPIDETTFGWSGGVAGEYVPDSILNSQMPNAQVLGSGGQGLTQIRLPDGRVTNATSLDGNAGDFSKLFEGIVPGAGYAQVTGEGAPKTQVVQGSDGNRYAALPSNAQVYAPKPDNAGFGSMFMQSFAPFVAPYAMYALGIPSLTDLISNATGLGSTTAATDLALGGGMGGMESLAAAPSSVATSFPVTSPGTVPSFSLGEALAPEAGPLQSLEGMNTLAAGTNNGLQYTMADAGAPATSANVNITQGNAGMDDWTSGFDVPSMNGGGVSTPDYGDLGMAPAGVTAPAPTASIPGVGDAYGSPLNIIKNLTNGNLIPGVSANSVVALTKLLGGGGAGSASGVLKGLLDGLSPTAKNAIFGNMTQPQGNYQFPWANVLSGILGYAGQNNMAKAITDATKYATDKADPFASQRSIYQGKLADAYNNPSSFLNNPLFTTARDDAINATQRKLAANGFNASGNEGLELTKAGTSATLNQAMPYMDLLSTNAGAKFSPAGAGQTALTGGMAAAQASNSAMGNLGYAASSAANGQQPSILESMFNLPSNKNLQQAITGASF